MRSSRRLALGAALVLAAPFIAWGLAVLGPGEAPSQGYGPQAGRRVLAADGQTLADLGRAPRRTGDWLKPGQVSPLLKAAALAAEDRRFASHPGVDLLAILRAAWGNLRAGKITSGGSTITMQVARLERPTRRGWWAKLREARRALWLEARLGKDEILAQYLNRAPFGGPLVGISVASRELLGSSPDRLAPQEAALLLALPQDPSRLLRPENRPRLQRRRDAILRSMAAAGALDAPALERALAQPAALSQPPAPALEAPHFAAALARRLPALAPTEVATDLDPGLQTALAALVRQACQPRSHQGLRQAAMLVLRNRDRAVLAWVGSQDFQGPINGQVDGVLALRQPGSALKPFVYALALEQGRTLADLIEDEPLALNLDSGGSFRPVDYDGRHRGRVSLRQALGSSLNLPALRLAEALGPPRVLAKLRLAGLELPLDPEHYGLGLALGDGEVSLLELTQAYAALARGGWWAPARLWRGQAVQAPHRVVSEQVAGLITSVLADDQARALGFGRHGLLELPFPAAVKTGTSQQHRDNWCLGFTSRFTVGVWVGNFEGEPMKGISGVVGAGPLWRQAMLYLHRQEPGSLPPPAGDLLRLRVCVESGHLAGPACPACVEELFLPDSPPPPACPLHAPRAETAPLEPRLTLVAPAPEAIYALDPDLDPSLQVLPGRVSALGPVTRAQWILDGRELPSGHDPLRMRLPLSPGRHLLEVTASGPGGRSSAAARFQVLGSGASTTSRP